MSSSLLGVLGIGVCLILALLSILKIHALTKKDGTLVRYGWSLFTVANLVMIWIIVAHSVSPILSTKLSLVEYNPTRIVLTVDSTLARNCRVAKVEATTKAGSGVERSLRTTYVKRSNGSNNGAPTESGLIFIWNEGVELPDISVDVSHFCPLGVEVKTEHITKTVPVEIPPSLLEQQSGRQ